MGAITQIVGPRTVVTVPGFSSLAAGAFCVSNTISFNTTHPVEVVLDVGAITLDPPTGDKRVLVFLQESLNGATFRNGPTSGTDATDQAMLLQLGVLELGAAGDGRATFPIASVLGYVPHSARVVFKNEAGGDLGTASLYVSEISMSVA